jgi:anaerobic selenocysteine-containing dehydrogenase
VIDPLSTETSEFWKNYGEFNNVDASKIQTEVFRLPATCFAEQDGTFTNSGRVIQWHWKGADGPGESKSDQEIMAGLFTRVGGTSKDTAFAEERHFELPVAGILRRHPAFLRHKKIQPVER